ncbi:peptide/nickel transport system substrate-binding protein [Evansella caseinilytica]|uniref:Peptide/nickel transport system substrate-binding protein n=1 Tax=Evansella caseinilytica TaxID=1503961 RepID=A0A1H3UY22_9BACI|nr:oligopeptide ABC transporter substrate-binding protein [Evansella caseinilytica]SDZ67247.1 peptide/nickel transport system substrate-binding protein [Evansella caseinilytica]
MKKSLLLLLAMLLSISMLVVACGGGDNDDADDNQGESEGEENGEQAEGDVPQGGVVTYGFGQPFAGVLDWAHYAGQDDSLALKIFNGDALVKNGDDLMAEPNLATWTVSEDKYTITFKLEEGVMWHNGVELTTEDVAFAWEVIADPDYTGPRWSNVNIIDGAEEYKNGEADEISGINIVDDYTIEVTFRSTEYKTGEEVPPLPNAIDQLWTYPMPKEHLKDVPVKDFEDADEVRRNPVGLGPYKVTNIVPGEQIEFEAFEDYWKGAPNLDGVVYKIVDGSMAGDLLVNGEIDIYELPPSQVVNLQDDERIKFQEKEGLNYSYIGFKLGHWDGEKNVMDNPKFADKNVRHAIAHAINRQGILDSFSEGYGTVINAPESVISWAYPDESSLTQYDYDPEKAKQLLDDAGYVDSNGDGWRDTPEGEEFTINFMAMEGTDIAEPRATYIVQNLQDVGLNARLQDGQLFDFNLFYDLVEEDDPDIDLFMGAWGLSADPDPTGLWKEDDLWNFPRWVNEESEKLIKEGLSVEAFDLEYRRDVYQQWHQLVNEELPIIPLSSPVRVYGIAADVHGVTGDVSDALTDPHLWYRDN